VHAARRALVGIRRPWRRSHPTVPVDVRIRRTLSRSVVDLGEEDLSLKKRDGRYV
jgi:hypothetical protein